MKKEGMMRLFGEEKQGLVTDPGIYKLLFLLISIHSINYSQTSINGFCKYSSFHIDSGYTSVFQINFNNDAYSDLVLFNPDKNDILVLKGDINGTFTNQKKYSSPVPFSNLETIINRQNIVTGYFFTSRKTLKAGIIAFNESGKPAIQKEIKLSSYPDFINIRDYDRNNTSDYLISGGAFNGISLLYEANNVLKEKQIVNRGSYSKAVFSDISGDGFPDIAALNIISNSIDLFYNNAAGGFYKVRSLPFESKITFFRMHDIDLDGYDDIIITQGEQIKVYYGDFASSFSNELIISTDYNAVSLLTADYNKDGLMDIAYFDQKEDMISIIFAEEQRTYKKEILYLKKNNLEKVVPFYSRFVNGIIALSSSGELYTITNLTAISDYVNITAGILPSEIKYFDYYNDGITDYAFLDEYDHELKIIIRNKEGIPSKYYSYTLFERCNNFTIESLSENSIRFFCYSTGKKLIEIIDADLSTAGFRRSSIYSPGNIYDIKIGYDEENNQELFIAFNSGGKLGITKVTREDFKYVFKTTLGISSNIDDAWFGKEKSDYIYYWNHQNSIYHLARISYNRLFDDIRKFGSFHINSNCSIFGITGDLLNAESDYTISFFRCGRENLTISASDSLFLSFKNNSLSELGVTGRKQLFYGEIRLNGLKRLICYSLTSKKIYEISLVNNGRKIITTELIDAPGMRSFFIKNMSFRNYHLVYTNSTENCITIVQL